MIKKITIEIIPESESENNIIKKIAKKWHRYRHDDYPTYIVSEDEEKEINAQIIRLKGYMD